MTLTAFLLLVILGILLGGEGCGCLILILALLGVIHVVGLV